MDFLRVFYWLINTSVKGSLLVISILLIKACFNKRLGVRWHYYIWFLLLPVLILPYMPQSSISIFNLPIFSGYNSIISEGFIQDVNNNSCNSNSNRIIIDETTDFFMWDSKYSDDVEEVPSKLIGLFLRNNLKYIFVMIWGAVAALLILFTIVVNIRFGFAIKKSNMKVSKQTNELLKQCKSNMNLKSKLRLVQTTAIKSPALFGLFKPKLLLPIHIEEQIDEDKLRFIFLHELSHLKRKDIAILWFIKVAKIVYWFNPIIWYGLHRMHQDCEISCDALALSYVDEKEYKNYGQTIIQLIQTTIKPIKFVGAVEMLGYKKMIKRRIKMISLFKKNTNKISLTALLIIMMLGFTFLTNAQEFKNDNLSNEDKIAIPYVKQDDSISDINSEQNIVQNTVPNEELKKMIWPLPSSTTISSPFGTRKHPILKTEHKHNGIDIPATIDSSIIASADGVVIYSEEDTDYGKTIKIEHKDGIVTMYAHCNELLVNKDQKVKAGEEIAKVGNTGHATGPHLHFEIRKEKEPVNPLDYVSNDSETVLD